MIVFRLSSKAINVFSKFAGYGTAELAAAAVLQHRGGDAVQTSFSSADINKHCQNMLSNNPAGNAAEG